MSFRAVFLKDTSALLRFIWTDAGCGWRERAGLGGGRRRAGRANDGEGRLGLGGARDFAADEKAQEVEEEPERGKQFGQDSAAGAGQCEGDEEYRDDAQEGDGFAGRGPHSVGRIAWLGLKRRDGFLANAAKGQMAQRPDWLFSSRFG